MKYTTVLMLFAFLPGLALANKSSGGTSHSVYLVESLRATNSELEGPYCVKSANITLSEWQANYSGLDGAKYNCSIQFQLEGSEGQKVSTRTISYSGRPVKMQKKNAGDMAKERFGFFGFFAANDPLNSKAYALDNLLFVVPNSVLHSVYSGLGFLSDLFTGDTNENMLNLVPNFEEVVSSMHASCYVIAKEIKAAACDETVSANIDQQLAAKESLKDYYEELIPKRD